MAAREVIALNESVPQLQAPQSGDTYSFPRAVTGDIEIVSGNIIPASDGVGNVGTATRKFRRFYGNSATMHFGNGTVDLGIGVGGSMFALTTGGAGATVSSSGLGSLLFGRAGVAAAGGIATVSAAGAFSLVGGQAGTYYATDTALLTATNTASMALGNAYSYGADATLSSTGFSSFAHAEILGTTATSSLIVSGNGAFGNSNIQNSEVLVSGDGAFFSGQAIAGNNVTISGSGAAGFGNADTGVIVASADNTAQFGPGTNATADSLQVGANFMAKANGQHGGNNASVTLGSSVTTFAATSNLMTITGDSGNNTIATITGGIDGQLLTLIFVDALVTITDNNAHAANSVDLSAAFTSADDTALLLQYDNTSWYELSRSMN